MKKINFALSGLFVLNTIVAFAQPGTLDSTFGVNGLVKTQIGIYVYCYARSVAIQKDGKIVVAGMAEDESDVFALVRYMTDGKIDNSFGNAGEVTTDFGNRAIAYSVAIQEDGKIVASGYVNNGVNHDFALVRYKLNGSLDSAFGENGKVTTDFGDHDNGNSVAIQADGRIVVAGYSGSQFALVRYMDNGNPDSAFGENGKVRTNSGTGNSVAIQPDGKILVAGYSGSSTTDFALVRYRQNGKLDSAFGENGKVVTDFEGNDYGTSVAIQKDGRIVVAGYSLNSSSYDYDFALVRYMDNGNPDSAFGKNGKVTTDLFYADYGNSVAIQTDGKIMVAGESNGDFALARYRSDGQPDSVFGTNGKVISEFGSDNEGGYSVAIQLDGKIVVAGITRGYIAVARYKGDDIILPVRIVNLKAWQQNNTVKINWTSLNELNVSEYNIERTDDGKDFNTLGKAKAFNNGQPKIDYSFTDILPMNRDNFYRIKAVDKDGTISYTNIVHINIESNNAGYSLSPNPAKDMLRIQGLSSSAKTISIVDITGRALQKTVTANTDYSCSIKQLQAGIYFIRINDGEKITTLKFIKE